MKTLFRVLLLFLLCINFNFLVSNEVDASLGVGIMPGIIRVDKELMPGGYYKLPDLQAVNTGSEASRYEIVVARMEEQDELQPPVTYISFSPVSFNLEADKSQVISLALDIPVNAKPGDYLAYVEAHPISPASGGTSIGIAAAAKIYFTIKPANTLAGIVNAIGNFFSRTSPFSYIMLGAIILGILIFFLRRQIKLEVRVTKRDK
jgi:hypothetical protein